MINPNDAIDYIIKHSQAYAKAKAEVTYLTESFKSFLAAYREALHDELEKERQFDWPKLEKPALVSAGTFGVGVSSRLVVEAAQRQYEYKTNPEKYAQIQKGINEFIALLHEQQPTESRAEIHRLEAENAALREWIAECRDTVLYPVAHADTEVGKRAELLGAATVALLRPNA